MFWNMIAIVALTSLILLERSDFVNLVVATSILTLFVSRKSPTDYTKQLYLFERGALIICSYDFLWLLSHYSVTINNFKLIIGSLDG